MILNTKIVNAVNYNRIRELRYQNKVTEEELAAAIGLSIGGYQKMMKLETCTVSRLETIADFFKVPVTYFFEEDLPSNYDPRAEKKQTVKEKRGSYLNCKDCAEKDRTIKAQHKTIEILERLVAVLEGNMRRPNGTSG